MKGLIKNKITWIVSGIVILVIIILSVFFIFLKDKEIKELKENTYTMYIKTNELSKLTFNESYYECKNNKETKICSDYTYKVLTSNNLSDATKTIDLRNKDIIEALLEIYNISENNPQEYSYIKIITNWDNKYSESDIKEKIGTDKEVIIVKQEVLNEEEIISQETKIEEEKVYIVKFDSDGGNIVNSQIVKENELVTKPENPIKDGYNFKEWQLNGMTYDFNSRITNEITLKATWEKQETSKPNNTTKPNNPSKPNTGNNNQGGNTGNNNKPNEGNKPTPEKKLVYVKDAEEVRTCSNGYTLENGNCVKKADVTVEKSCGGIEINGKCYRNFVVHKDYYCDGNDIFGEEYHFGLERPNTWIFNFCRRESSNFSYYDTYPAHYTLSCPGGGELMGDKCLEELGYNKREVCPSGWDKVCEGYGYEAKCHCSQKAEPTITYTCGNLIMQDNKCYKYE